MVTFRRWPLHRIALAGMWALGVCAVVAVRVFWLLSDAPVAAVGFSLIDPMLLALVPPLLLELSRVAGEAVREPDGRHACACTPRRRPGRAALGVCWPFTDRRFTQRGGFHGSPH